MGRTVADQFAATLAAAGVKRIYGIVGDSLNGLTDAIRRQGRSSGSVGRGGRGVAAGAEAHLTRARRCAAAAGRAICTSSTVCSTVTARASRCSASPRRSPRPRSAAAIFRRPIRSPVPGVQPLLRARLGRQPDAARARGRDPQGGRQARRLGAGAARRRGAAACERGAAGEGRGLLPPAPVVTPARTISNVSRHCSTATVGSRSCAARAARGRTIPRTGGRLVRRRGMRRDVSAMREWPATKDRVRAGERPQIIGTKVLPPRCVGLIDAPPA